MMRNARVDPILYDKLVAQCTFTSTVDDPHDLIIHPACLMQIAMNSDILLNWLECVRLP